MLVGIPFEALPLGKVRTGQRLMVLNGEVITHPSMGLTCLPFMNTESYDWSQSAGTAGRAVVGQMSTLCFSRIGPRVAYILFATSSVGTKSTASESRPFSANVRG